MPVHRQPTSDPVTGGAEGPGSETVMDLVKQVDRLAAAMRPGDSSPGEIQAAG